MFSHIVLFKYYLQKWSILKQIVKKYKDPRNTMLG